MTEAGKRLLAAAHEALAFAKGEADASTYVVHAPPSTVDVKAIRSKMGMTQAEFGARFGFGKARVRDWEQQRTRPAASDRVLLVTIDTDPNSVLRALELHEVERKIHSTSEGIKRAKPKARPSAQKVVAG